MRQEVPTAMNPEQIIEYARQERYRVVVTEQMVITAMKGLSSPFTCRDVVAALPRDDRGSSASEYLVALWIENFIDRRLIHRTGAATPRTYAVLSDRDLAEQLMLEQLGRDRMHCGVLSYTLTNDTEWCSLCGSLRVNGKYGENWIKPKRARDGR